MTHVSSTDLRKGFDTIETSDAAPQTLMRPLASTRRLLGFKSLLDRQVRR